MQSHQPLHILSAVLFLTTIWVTAQNPAQVESQAAHSLGSLPMFFIENQGQWPTDARYVANNRAYMVRFHDNAMVLQCEQHGEKPKGVALRFSFVDGSPDARLETEEPLPARMHYMIGARERWRTHVKTFGRLRYKNVWPGVDLRVHDSNGELEYDVMLAPGADLERVVMRCEGAVGIELDADGAMVIQTALGELRQLPPTTFEILPDGTQRAVASKFRLLGEDRYGFEVERSDPSLSLIVDPVLLWSTYVGAAGSDLIRGLEVMASGNVTVAGSTDTKLNFPITPGAYQLNLKGLNTSDGFVLQLDPSKAGVYQLVWGTYLGGSGSDLIWSVAESIAGSIAMVGRTNSDDFPTSAGAYQSARVSGYDAVVVRLSPDGSALEYGSYLGGDVNENLFLIAVHPSGEIDVAGSTDSTNYPTTTGAPQVNYGGGTDGCITRLDPSQSGPAQLVFSTYMGTGQDDSIGDLAISPALPGVVTVCGNTLDWTSMKANFAGPVYGTGSTQCFLARFDPGQVGAAQSVFYHAIAGYAEAVALNSTGAATIAFGGSSLPGSFPNAFHTAVTYGGELVIARFTSDGQFVEDATFTGFLVRKGYGDVHIGSNDSVMVFGVMSHLNGPIFRHVPITADAIDPNKTGAYASTEVAVQRFSPKLTHLLYGSYIGGAGHEFLGTQSVHVAGDVVTVGGFTTSTDLDVVNAFQPIFQSTLGGYDGFIYRFDISARPSGPNGVPAITTTNFGVGDTPIGVILSDLNNDSALDIATANAGSDDVTIRLNDGSGGFGATPATISLAPSTDPVAIGSGDLDGDGQADDLAIACEASNDIVLILNAATTPVVMPPLPSAGKVLTCLAVGTLNPGATADVVVGRYGELLTGGAGLEVIMDGAVPVELPIPAGRALRVVGVVLADLDNDGNQDLVALAHGSADEILLWSNDGTGSLSFVGKISLPTNSLADGLCVADLNSDGNNDIVVALPQLFPPSQSVRIHRYTGSGSLDPGDYTAASDFTTSGQFAEAIACADLDRDDLTGFVGGVDLVMTNRGTADLTAEFSYNGARFLAHDVLPAGTRPVDLALGTLDSGVTIDIVCCNQGSGDVTVTLVRGDFMRPFGRGCSGTNGIVPKIEGRGSARIGGTLEVNLTQGMPSALAFLLFSGTPLTTNFGACNLYLGTPLVQLFRYLDVNGSDSFRVPVPSTSTFIGIDLFFQWVVVDPAGAYMGLSFSDALRIQIGR